MPRPIEFYYDYSSPYGYLAAQRIDALAAGFGRAVTWKPILLGAVFKTTGMRPLLEIPLKGDYAKRDLTRSARRAGVPFVLPEPFPFASVAACRATYWLAERDEAAARTLARALFARAFGEGGDISRAESVAAVAATLGHDEREILEATREPRIKDLLRREVEAAMERGVFGSPFVIVDGEPFWGYDRLGDVAAWLETGGW